MPHGSADSTSSHPLQRRQGRPSPAFMSAFRQSPATTRCQALPKGQTKAPPRHKEFLEGAIVSLIVGPRGPGPGDDPAPALASPQLPPGARLTCSFPRTPTPAARPAGRRAPACREKRGTMRRPGRMELHHRSRPLSRLRSAGRDAAPAFLVHAVGFSVRPIRARGFGHYASGGPDRKRPGTPQRPRRVRTKPQGRAPIVRLNECLPLRCRRRPRTRGGGSASPRTREPSAPSSPYTRRWTPGTALRASAPPGTEREAWRNHRVSRSQGQPTAVSLDDTTARWCEVAHARHSVPPPAFARCRFAHSSRRASPHDVPAPVGGQ